MPRPLAVLLALAAAAAVVLLPAPVASAAPNPSVSPSTVQRGGSLTVSGTGCLDPEYDPYGGTGRLGWWVSVSTTPWNSSWTHVSGSTQTNEWDGGAWSVTLRLPDNVGPGSYAAYAHCFLGDEEWDYLAVPFTVVGEPIPPNWWEPGGSGPPGQPKGPPVAAPPATRGAPSSPRTQSPGATSAPSSAHTTAPAPIVPPTPTPTSGPAADCADCAALADGRALAAGRTLRLVYPGFQPGEVVTVVLRSTPTTLGTYTADAAGTLTATVTLPDDTEAGEHTLTFSGPASGDLVVVPITVAAPESSRPTDVVTAPATRSVGRAVILWLGAGGLAVVVVSLGAHMLVHRRRADREPGTTAPDQPTGTAIP